MSILDRLYEYRKLLVTDTEPRQYRVVGSFEGTTMASEGMVSPMFRPFNTVKEAEHRNTNVSPGFDMYTDSLMDYPTIMRYKIGSDEWEPYNKLISVHVPLCPFNCWHCYNDKKLYFSPQNVEQWPFEKAENIVGEFLKQHKQDAKNGHLNKRNESNVLRITGGEPFLVPELILDCLELLERKRNEFQRPPFLWTETDLWPFISEDGQYFKELIYVLPKLAKYQNLAVHPCLHGITDPILKSTTGQADIKVGQLLKGIETLLAHRIDIYPTFGSNVNPPEAIEELFKELYRINRHLPLRFALVRYDLLRYPEIEERLKEEKSRVTKLFSYYTSLRVWNTLLMRHYGVGYGVIPRHLVPLYGEQSYINPAPNFMEYSEYKPRYESETGDLIYVFKSSYRDDYHRELLDILALPKGHIFKLEYNVEWVQDDLCWHMKMRPEEYVGRDALLIYGDDRSRYEKFIPLRWMKLKKIEVIGNVLVMHLELGDFLYRTEVKNKDAINKKERTFRDELDSLFGGCTIPGTIANKFVLIGEYLKALQEFKHGSEVPAWRGMVEALHKEELQAFKESLFFYIPKEKMNGLGDVVTSEAETVYSCEAGKKFSFEIYYYLPNYEAFHRDSDRRTIHFETSSDIVMPLVPNDFVLSKYGSENLNFGTKLLLHHPERCTIFFRGKKEPYMAPAPRIIVEIEDVSKEARQTRGFGTALVGLGGGVFGGFVTGDVTGDLCWWLRLLVIFVAFILTFSLFYVGGWWLEKYPKT